MSLLSNPQQNLVVVSLYECMADPRFTSLAKEFGVSLKEVTFSISPTKTYGEIYNYSVTSSSTVPLELIKEYMVKYFGAHPDHTPVKTINQTNGNTMVFHEVGDKKVFTERYVTFSSDTCLDMVSCLVFKLGEEEDADSLDWEQEFYKNPVFDLELRKVMMDNYGYYEHEDEDVLDCGIWDGSSSELYKNIENYED